MAVTLGKNLFASRAQFALDRTTHNLSKSLKALASGQRINDASDDAAGLSVSSKLQANIRVYSAAIRNINDGISLLNIAQGAVSELSNIITRQKELAEQAANGVYSARQRGALNTEMKALVKEYNRIVQSTSFNSLKIIDGDSDTFRIQQGFGVEQSTFANVGSELGVSAGNGTFASATSIATDYAYSLYGGNLADVNDDGKLDIIGMTTTNFVVKFGNGNGTFAAERSVAAASIATTAWIEAQDLNGDGVLDIVGAAGGGNILVALGTGNGSFASTATYSIGAYTGGLALRDINNDGAVDLVGGVGAANAMFVALGNGNGSFKTRTTFATAAGVAQVAVADVNGDGAQDIVTSGNSVAAIFYGNGYGSFGARQTLTITTSGLSQNSGSTGIAISDLNNDGNSDLAIGGVDQLDILLSRGDGTFYSPISAFTNGANGFSHTGAGDFNADGILDFSMNNLGGEQILISNGNGTFRYSAFVTQPVIVDAVVGHAVGDLNGDGVPDLLCLDDGGGYGIALGNPESSGKRNNLLYPMDLTTKQGALEALDRTTSYLDRIHKELGALGALESRFLTALNTTQSSVLQYHSANAAITDVDVVAESAKLTSNQVLQNVGVAVLAQANLQPDLSLTLLTN